MNEEELIAKLTGDDGPCGRCGKPGFRMPDEQGHMCSDCRLEGHWRAVAPVGYRPVDPVFARFVEAAAAEILRERRQPPRAEPVDFTKYLDERRGGGQPE